MSRYTYFIFTIALLVSLLPGISRFAGLHADSGNKSLEPHSGLSTFGIAGPDFQVYKLALSGFRNVKQKYNHINDSIITIIDYTKPSTEERIFVIDVKHNKILSSSLVAHGKSTGILYAEHFSNTPSSHKSSLGFFITDKTYRGKHGYSLRIKGIEEGINDNAMKRAIVFHGASYVSSDYIEKYGRIGRSFGCPALPVDKNKEIIDLIKNNTCIFIYAGEKNYTSQSEFIRSDRYF